MELRVLPMGLSQNKSPSLFCLQGFFFFLLFTKMDQNTQNCSQPAVPLVQLARIRRQRKKAYNHIKSSPSASSKSHFFGKKKRGSVKEKRRCNYHKHRLRDQLHFKETRALCPRLHTAPSISAVRVGKHEQITRLLIAARSEEVSTLLLPGRNSLSPAHSATSWKSASAQELYLNSASCSRGRAHNAKPTAATQRHKHTFCNCASPGAVAAVWTQQSRTTLHLSVLLNYYSAHFETYCQELSCSSMWSTP